jgi:hypothetical protein
MHCFIRFSGKNGVTLTELIVATGILVFAVSGILLLFVNCAFLNESSRNLTSAVSHAQFVMEDIKNTTFSQIVSDAGDGRWDWGIDDIESAELMPLNNESIETTLAGLDPLDISVTVHWQDRNQRDRAFILKTLITSP